VLLSDFVAPTVVATGLSSAASFFVARATARSTVRTAEIGAAVERDKLAHTREQFRATRRDMARGDVLRLNERMEYVANAEAVLSVRTEAAREAHRLLLGVAMILGDEATGGDRVDELLTALQAAALDRAAALWPDVRQTIRSSDVK
jgi:hypothetical protein